MQRTPKAVYFQFRFVKAGHRVSFRSVKGRVAEKVLNLGDEEIPFNMILDTTSRGDHVYLHLSPGAVLESSVAQDCLVKRTLVVEPKDLSARALEMAIDRRCAALEAEDRRAVMEANGEQHLIRTEQCPACQATVDLTGLQPTPYVYCRYCESIFTANKKRVTSGDKFRQCDDCGLFDRIQDYPEFYFYFLVFVYGYRYRKVFLCDACAQRLSRRALLLNALFVIGVPTAIWVKLKSAAERDTSFPQLAEANALAQEGKYQEADIKYKYVLRVQRDHPAVLMNQALGHVNGGDVAGAGALLEKSLTACGNYVPVLRILQAS